MDATQRAKAAAAKRAAELIEDGMRVGLGTGSTASLFVRALGERVRAGIRVVGVPTSEAIAWLARAEGIALTTLEDTPELDICVDGADAVDPAFNLVKGMGGALLREKIVALASKRFVVMVGEEKLVDSLERFPVVPVEVVRFGWTHVRARLQSLGCEAHRRGSPDDLEEPFLTDGGNYIIDCKFGSRLGDPAALAQRIKCTTGVVDHGLFIGMVHQLIVGTAEGDTRVIDVR